MCVCVYEATSGIEVFANTCSSIPIIVERKRESYLHDVMLSVALLWSMFVCACVRESWDRVLCKCVCYGQD